jgi:hypothetical protein
MNGITLRMKQFLILLIGFILLSQLTCSPKRPPRHVMGPPPDGVFPLRETPEELIIGMKLRLDLTDEQEEKVLPILEEQYKKQCEIIEKYRGQGAGGRDSLRSELRGLQESCQERLRPILTAEQMEGYKKMIAEQLRPPREGRHRGMPGGRGGGMGGDRGGGGGPGREPPGPEI